MISMKLSTNPYGCSFCDKNFPISISLVKHSTLRIEQLVQENSLEVESMKSVDTKTNEKHEFDEIIECGFQNK